MSLLVENARIVTQNEGREIFEGSVYVEGNRIVEVSKGRINVEAERKLDGTGCLLMPGLINTHTHAPMTLLRGYGDDMLLEEWLHNRIWPVEAKLTPATVDVGTKLALLEMISSGTTCFSDMYFFEDTIARVTRDAGVRGFLGFSLLDFGTPEIKPDEMLCECERYVRRWKGEEIVKPVVAPHATYTCSPELLSKCAEIADENGVLLHTHCSETRKEIYDVQNKYGKRPVQQLADCGLLGERTTLAHCGWLTKQEVADIARAEAKVSHNPVSNMKLATGGYTPLPELFDAGATVGLGTDGAASNNTLDMFETMKFAALIHKHHRWDPQVCNAQAVLDMATLGGAETLGLGSELGSIEEGRLADFILLDTKNPRMTPMFSPVSHLVYAARGSDVKATVINGKMVYENGKFATLDCEMILEDARSAASELSGKAAR
ncbi:MAG: hypothetical protein CVT48_04795 [Thermoplasmata archaeon HGW-Thermoplasmata-1]|nr:MAG: hypothetical protein CVT48_04795 [Thermoplasmata archaeon HGW-Thermoplasmata-1]